MFDNQQLTIKTMSIFVHRQEKKSQVGMVILQADLTVTVLNKCLSLIKQAPYLISNIRFIIVDKLLDLVDKESLLLQTRSTPNGFAILKHDQSRYRLHSVARS